MQGVSGSSPLGSIFKSQAWPGFFYVWPMAPRLQWFDTLHLSISQKHGKGWSVRERNPVGRAQLTSIWEACTRSRWAMSSRDGRCGHWRRCGAGWVSRTSPQALTATR